MDKAYKLHMKRAVAKKTFDGLGVHCPYDTAGDIGYRPLSMTEKELKKVLQRVRMMDDGTIGRLSTPTGPCVLGSVYDTDLSFCVVSSLSFLRPTSKEKRPASKRLTT